MRQEGKQDDDVVEGIDSWGFHCLAKKYVPL